jgi:ABC-2 type transport system permease protein
VRKELQAIARDKQSRRLLIVPIILQLLLFPFAATLEVKNNVIAVLDEDGGATSAEIVQRLTHTPAFHKVLLVFTEAEARRVIDRQDALVVLRFGPRFSRSAAAGTPEPAQALLDGRRSNSAQIAVGYVAEILDGIPLARGPDVGPVRGPAVRHWYNPNLDYFRFIVPSLVAIITTISALVVTALSIAREREQGTLEQLLVSPLTPSLIFFGKAVPALLVAAFQATIILAGGVFGYDIPFRGSLVLLYACMGAYVIALIGIGLLVSSFCATQQQAFLGVFLFVMPAVLLSGYVTPIDNMPRWLAAVTWANPIRHFIVIVKALYLKGAPFSDFATNVVALLVIGAITATTAHTVLRRRLA